MCEYCEEVAKIYQLDINRLLEDLAKQKWKEKEPRPLTDTEKRHLCLSLLGYNALGIAIKEEEDGIWYSENKERRSRNIKTSMSRTINSYVKDLIYTSNDDDMKQELNESNGVLPTWIRILSFLLQNNYKKERAIPEHEIKGNYLLVEVPYEAQVELKNIADLIKTVNQKFGQGSLKIKEVYQRENNDNE